ncbi:MAG: beta-N-acetylhexosaminidase [Hyphomicrobiales bacterium]|nr:beta-N-acetylhexosaminidase [Hyphomicrobiales bacterium]MDE2113930.1 beta-N-acetylhexosaminidase [Hyphomicrobiales bacterium]
MTVRAFICGCKGLVLQPEEVAFLRAYDPWGLILFKRNVDTPAQVQALVAQFRAVVGRADAPVLIDQEGGRVQRLGPPHWLAYPSAAQLAGTDPEANIDRVRQATRLIAHDLQLLGITVDCLPVLDVPAPGGHNVIGDRAYASNAVQVARLGLAAAQALLAGGVLPVIKHIPGHGRADADTHLSLPIVRTPRRQLEAVDFAAFVPCRHLPLAMTAHVVYADIDPDHPATTSRIVIEEIIRGYIGFEGLLMSDDLSMQALQGSLGERAVAAFAAGIDMALHCNGHLDEAEQVATHSPPLQGVAAARAAAALAQIHMPQAFDPVDAAARLSVALAAKP